MQLNIHSILHLSVKEEEEEEDDDDMGLLVSDKGYEGLYNQKLSRSDWLLEIARVEAERLVMQENNKKKEMMVSKSTKEEPDWAAAAERESETPLMVSESKRESLMREKALKKPMLFVPKKPRSAASHGPKLMHSAIDSLIQTNSLKRNFQSIDDHVDDDDWKPEKKQRSSEPDVPKLMHSAIDSLRKTNALKRNFKSIGDDNVDWPALQSCKRQKMNVKKATASIKITQKKKKKKESISPSSSVHHDLPEEFKTRIDSLGGTNVALVIQKKLTKTDLTPSGNRMSMPLNQIVSTDFLIDDERDELENEKTMTVQLIDPGLAQGDINLRRWDMKKGVGIKTSKMYVLRTQWGDVARRNRLRQDDLVQVWSFRVNEELYLALVLVEGSGGDHLESDEGGCKSSVVDGNQSSSGGPGGSQEGGSEIIEERRDGNNGNNSGGSQGKGGTVEIIDEERRDGNNGDNSGGRQGGTEVIEDVRDGNNGNNSGVSQGGTEVNDEERRDGSNGNSSEAATVTNGFDHHASPSNSQSGSKHEAADNEAAVEDKGS